MSTIANFSGLASGLDTDQIVTQLVKLERQPIARLEDRKSDMRSMSQRFENVRNLMRTLGDKVRDLDSSSDVLSSKASSSDEKIVKASAAGGASIGSFGIEVLSLARPERTYSDVFASKTDTGLFGSGQFSIQVGSGSAATIDVDANDSLETLAAKINSSDAKVTAGIIFDGTGYRLQVSSEESGLANALTFSEDAGVSLGLSKASNEAVAASDAVFKIDGITMTRGSNSVADAIPGVTLTLNATSGTQGPTTVSIERDPEALGDKLDAFVKAYNAVADAVNKEFAFTGTAKTGNSLAGDSTLRTLQSRIRDDVMGSVSGLSGNLQRLTDLGVEIAKDGKLSLDEEKLKSAVAKDPNGVADLLAGKPDGSVEGLMKRFAKTIDTYTRTGDGVLSTRIDGYSSRMRDLDSRIDDMERRLDKYEERMRARFAAMENVISGLVGQGSQLSAVASSLGG